MDLSVNEVDLKVISVSDTEIRAALPSLAPGTYRLAIRQSRNRNEVARFVVTLGGGGTTSQPGPQGPAGPMGPMGPVGPAGPRGLQGLQGLQGIQGLKGDKGDTGAAGPAGPAGGGLTVVSANGLTLGSVVGVSKINGSDPTIVARKEGTVWLAIPVDKSGVVPMNYPVFFDAPGCGGIAYAVVDGPTTPLFRLLQRESASAAMAFYGSDSAPSNALVSLMDPMTGPSSCQRVRWLGMGSDTADARRADLARRVRVHCAVPRPVNRTGGWGLGALSPRPFSQSR